MRRGWVPSDSTNVSRCAVITRINGGYRWLYGPVPGFGPLGKVRHFGPLSRNPSLGFGFRFKPMKACHAALIERVNRHAAAIIRTDSVPLHARTMADVSGRSRQHHHLVEARGPNLNKSIGEQNIPTPQHDRGGSGFINGSRWLVYNNRALPRCHPTARDAWSV